MTGQAKMVCAWDGPRALVALVALSALTLAVEAFDYRDSLWQVWTSLLIGSLIGMPAVLYSKRRMRQRMDLYVTLAMRPMDGEAKRVYWKESIRVGGLLFLSMPLVALVSELLAVPNRSGIFMPLILLLLIYPEQKTIYHAAKARLAEMQKDAAAE